MTHVIAIANQKGGVGKTTVATNLAASLALGGSPTILIDLDPQAAASDALGFRAGMGLTVKNWYEDPSVRSVEKFLWQTKTPNLYLMPNELATMEITDAISRDIDPAGFIKEFVRAPAITKRFSYVIIDTPPNLDVHFRNGIIASHSVIIPGTPEIKTIKGLVNLHKELNRIKAKCNTQVMGVILTRISTPPHNTHKRLIDFFQTHYGDLLFDTKLSAYKDYPEADEKGIASVVQHSPGSNSAKAIISFTAEVLERIENLDTPKRGRQKKNVGLWDSNIARAAESLENSL